jgi:aspartate aminotransferase-like enzyme
MHICKQRLLTRGPTLFDPFAPDSRASDLHHRPEDFRSVNKPAVSNPNEVPTTADRAPCFAATGMGAMDVQLSNLFRRGDKVIVCPHGRRVEQGRGRSGWKMDDEPSGIMAPAETLQVVTA